MLNQPNILDSALVLCKKRNNYTKLPDCGICRVCVSSVLFFKDLFYVNNGKSIQNQMLYFVLVGPIVTFSHFFSS